MPSCTSLLLAMCFCVRLSFGSWPAPPFWPCCRPAPPIPVRSSAPTQEAQQYQAHAKRSYAPPGPPSDPWGPYIVEASQRFDVPERWIREVMRVESSGKVMDTSQAGAMGLMQVMPVTYDELRARYDLGDDPYDPHDNVMAGTAYLRQMYDVYGFPGFLAAYNAGPGRLDDYLTRNRPLPDETRNYVRKIAPYIVGISPNQVSAADSIAMNHLPMEIPPGPRYPRHQPAPVALAENRPSRSVPQRHVQVAALVEPPRPVPPAPPRVVPVPPVQPAAQHAGFRLIAPAMADTLPVQRVGGGSAVGKWAIQVGAYGNETPGPRGRRYRPQPGARRAGQCPRGGGHRACRQRNALPRPADWACRGMPRCRPARSWAIAAAASCCRRRRRANGRINGRSWLSLPCRGANIYDRN